MKILAIGDFHGKFLKKISNLVKKEKIDLVISTGDYPPFDYRDLWFKHCYGTDVELGDVVGKRKYKQLVIDDLRKGEVILKGLNRLSVPVFSVLGNLDWPVPDDVYDLPRKTLKSMPNWDRKDSFVKRMEKYRNIKRFDYSSAKFGIDFRVFLGKS